MGKAREILAGALGAHGVDAFGACDFTGVLPLLPCKAASRLPENPASVITCLFPYYTGDYSGRNISRYAVSDDYHTVAGDILNGAAAALSDAFPDESFAPFVDASPIREREAARLCGLGDIGRNGLLISRFYGSYVFIGCIVTSMYIEPWALPGGRYTGCRDCNKCVGTCPSGALSDPSSLPEKERCRSYISQKKGVLSEWEERQIRESGLVWGCDICQDVCPCNENPRLTPIRAFYDNIIPVLTKENLDTARMSKPYGYRGREVLLRNLDILGRG